MYLEVEAGDERQFLHRELLGRLLITATVTALDLCRAAKMFRPREPTTNTCEHSVTTYHTTSTSVIDNNTYLCI